MNRAMNSACRAGLVLSGIAACLVVSVALGQDTTTAATLSTELTPVTDAMLANPAPEDWINYRRTLDSWGYSPLDQVTRENVDEIRMVWTRALVPGTAELTPLAYEGVLYVPNTEDTIQALSARDRGLVVGVQTRLAGMMSGATAALSPVSPATLPLRPIHPQHQCRPLRLRARCNDR